MPRLANLELDALKGMSAQERSQVVNFNVGDAVDGYSFVVNAGDDLLIQTATPGDGFGEPDNAPDLSLVLFDPNGTQVAIDADGAADGRNASIAWTAAVSGFYRAEVRAAPGSTGAYVLTVAGSTATIDTTPPTVTATNVADDDVIPPGNLTFTAQFSEELATLGLGPDDVELVNLDTGQPVVVAPHGLRGDYYADVGQYTGSANYPPFDSLTPTVTRIDPVVDMGDGDGMHGLGLFDTFGVRWTGSIRIDTAGDTTFFTNSDDASRLFIDGALVVDNPGLHGTQERSGTVNLSQGFHDVRLEYIENGSGAYIGLSWQPQGGAKALIPTDVLFATSAASASRSTTIRPAAR